jgi:hypothetical protein
VALTEEMTVDWLSRGDLEREQLVGLIEAALVALVTMTLGRWPADEG